MMRTKDRVTLGVMPGAPETSGRTPLPLCELLCDIADVLKCIVDMQLDSSNNPTIQPLAGAPGEWLSSAGRVRPTAARLATSAPRVPGHRRCGAERRRRVASSSTSCRSGDGGGRSGGAPRAWHRRESPLLQGFWYVAHARPARKRGKVGRTSGDSRARMDESRRTPKRRGCRRIRTSDKDTAGGSRHVGRRGRRCFKANSARC
jgi:hypothetical protein